MMVINKETVEEKVIHESTNRKPHCEAFEANEATLDYISQQEEITPVDCVTKIEISLDTGGGGGTVRKADDNERFFQMLLS